MRLILSLILMLASPVLADQSPLVKLQTLNDSRGWEAVGKLMLGERGFCTGALIAPQLVLTAAHCLYDKETGARMNPSDIKFLAGWRNGRAAAYRGVRQAVTHPDYVYREDGSIDRVADDVALIELDQPILLPSIHPFAVGAAPQAGDVVGVVSYAQDRADNPSLQQQCNVMNKQTDILVMTCDVDFGSSGAPVFQMLNGVPQIVSVVSAKAEVDGGRVSLGSALQIPVARLMDALKAGDAARGDVAHVQILSGGLSGGAKFVKPTASVSP
ncbi:trypsin-like serine protease [bacterium]|nr:trypsin-like serine protease [bacterium]